MSKPNPFLLSLKIHLKNGVTIKKEWFYDEIEAINDLMLRLFESSNQSHWFRSDYHPTDNLYIGEGQLAAVEFGISQPSLH